MKKLFILILLTSTIWSCKKDECKQCTRNWSYHAYRKSTSGTVSNESNYSGITDTFYACDEDAIKAAEKGSSSHSETKVSNVYTDIVDGTATCSCN